MKLAIVSLLAVAAIAAAKPLENSPFLQHVLFCHQLGLAKVFDPKSLSADDLNALHKCQTTAEKFVAKKFGLTAGVLNHAKERFIADRPELIAALMDAAAAFSKRLEGTQTAKDMAELNQFMANHNLPTEIRF